MMSKPPLIPEAEEATCVVIIGAGLAGIAAAIALKEDLRFEGFTIYEKAQDGVGGVWRDNTYPGCGSDVPGHWYSLSRALNPHWKTRYPSQHEMRAYCDDVWTKHGLKSHTRFGTEVVRATWDDRTHTYAVMLEDVVSHTRRTVTARAVISAAGGFMSPHVPEDLGRGRERFKGVTWHSAEWRHDVRLEGKRVGVIGNGCSAAQFVPQISKDPSVEVINFCRSPQWYIPRSQYDYSAWAKWVFAHVPFAMRVYRSLIMAKSDINVIYFLNSKSLFQRLLRHGLTKYMKTMAPKKYHSMLLPQYPPGCKRMIVDPGYLECLHRPNVTLTYDAIECIVPSGVQLETGKVIPLDVIILGTGFELLPPRLEIFGVGGVQLADYWKSKGGPEAYYGLGVPNFPNYFMLLGPNSAGGHASVVFLEEVQIQHTMELIKPIIEGKVRSIVVREEASAKYNRWLQSRLCKSVWNSCNSWYRRDGGNGKITVTFPGSATEFWWFGRRPRYSDYDIVGEERARGRGLNGVMTVLSLVVVAALMIIQKNK